MTFKTNFNKAYPDNYELIFPKVPTEEGIEQVRPLTLNIYSTILPSLTLESAPSEWQGFTGQIYTGGITFEPWFVHFVVDSRFENWTTLYKWLTYINNNKDTIRTNMSLITVDASLRVTDNQENTIFSVDFIDCWINMLGEITLSHREGNVTLISTANLMYHRYEIKTIGGTT